LPQKTVMGNFCAQGLSFAMITLKILLDIWLNNYKKEE